MPDMNRDSVGDLADYADDESCFSCALWAREWVSKSSAKYDHWAVRGRCDVTGDLTLPLHACESWKLREGPLRRLKRNRSGGLVEDLVDRAGTETGDRVRESLDREES